MSENLRKDTFDSEEGDIWFSRNKPQLGNYDPEEDIVFRQLDLYGIPVKKPLEIGCSNGFRLNALQKKYDVEVYGTDISELAIEDGKKIFPALHLNAGTMDDLSVYEDAKFDLIVINYVFHWVDRKQLLKSIAEVDRVLADQGVLMIGDFYPESPLKTKYHHVEDGDVFTYKQDYEAPFLSSNLYQLIDKSTIDHNTKLKGRPADVRDRSSFVMLKKNLDAYLSDPS